MNQKNKPDNAFSALQEEHEAAFTKVARAIKSNIDGRRGFWTLVGDIIDLYVPKVVGTIFGANDKEPMRIETSDPETT